MAHNKKSRIKAINARKLRAIRKASRSKGSAFDKAFKAHTEAEKERRKIINPPRQFNPSAARRKRKRSIRGRR